MSALLNTRVLLSFGIILAVAATLISATGAFFFDTEASTGNTFSAGTLEIDVNDNTIGEYVAPFNYTGKMPGDLTVSDVSLKVIGSSGWIKTSLFSTATTTADQALAGFIHQSFYYSMNGGSSWNKIPSAGVPTLGSSFWDGGANVVYYHGSPIAPGDELLVRSVSCVGQLSNYLDNDPTNDTCNGALVTNAAQGGVITSTLTYSAMQAANVADPIAAGL